MFCGKECRKTVKLKQHNLSSSFNINRLSRARSPNDILQLTIFWSSMVLRFMRYCYYRRSAFPFLGRAAVNYIIQVTTSAMRHPQLKRFLSPPPNSGPSAIHVIWETECNFMLCRKSQSRGAGWWPPAVCRWRSLLSTHMSPILVCLAEARRQITGTAVEWRSSRHNKA